MNRHAQFALASISAGVCAAIILVVVGATAAHLIVLGERTSEDDAPMRAAGVISIVMAPAVFALVGVGTWILGYLAPRSRRQTWIVAGVAVLIPSLYLPVAAVLGDEAMPVSPLNGLVALFALIFVPLAVGACVWWKLVARALTERWSGP